MRRTMLATVAIAATTVVLASCSSPGRHPLAPPFVTSSPAAAPSSSAALDAQALVARLAAAVPGAKPTTVYTAATDPNGKLGRPHQYVSKANFEDSRAASNPRAAEDSPGDRTTITYGGTVEVFADADDAQAWTAQIDVASKAVAALKTPDYVFRHGTIVVRVSHLLTADQAAVYDKAIG